MLKTRRRRGAKKRKGAAVVELAVCLPIIVLLVFASIETCNMIFLRQALNASAYEGIRVAVRPDATSQQAINRCQAVLDGRGIQNSSIVFDPQDVSAVPRGQQIEVTVSAGCESNGAGPSWFFGGRTLEGRAVFVKE